MRKKMPTGIRKNMKTSPGIKSKSKKVCNRNWQGAFLIVPLGAFSPKVPRMKLERVEARFCRKHPIT
jgi:hypothetical protein